MRFIIATSTADDILTTQDKFTETGDSGGSSHVRIVKFMFVLLHVYFDCK